MSYELTEEQYLAIERAAEFKSEFLDGVMYAMSGGSMRHSYLAVKLVVELSAMLRGASARSIIPTCGFGFPPACTHTRTFQWFVESRCSRTITRTFSSTHGNRRGPLAQHRAI